MSRHTPDRHLDGVSVPLAHIVTIIWGRADAGASDDGGAWGYVVVIEGRAIPQEACNSTP